MIPYLVSQFKGRRRGQLVATTLSVLRSISDEIHRALLVLVRACMLVTMWKSAHARLTILNKLFSLLGLGSSGSESGESEEAVPTPDNVEMTRLISRPAHM
jgi:hypothetical protein